MGDENQIKRIVNESSRQYLEKSLELVQQETRPYDLATEYAATTRNRSFFVTGITLATVVVFAVAAVLVTQSISKATERQPVDVSSFQDLNLKDLLDGAKRAQEVHDGIARELSTLERERDAEIQAVKTALASELDVIAAGRGTEESKAAARAAATRRAQDKIRAIEQRYAPLIAAKKAELEDAAKALDAYDSRALAQAKENEERLAAERRLFDLEKERLTAYYEERIASLEQSAKEERERFVRAKDELIRTMEKSRSDELAETILKFNPIFEDPALVALATKPGDRGSRPSPVVPASVASAGIDAAADTASAEAAVAAIRNLGAALAAVPYVNSVPGALAGMERSAMELSAIYARICDLSAKALIARSKQVEKLTAELGTTQAALSASRFEAASFRAAIETLARDNGDAGYVLAVDGDELVLWIDTLMAGSGAREAWVFRDDMSIAKLRLVPDGALTRAVVISRAEGETPRPFDLILASLSGDAGGNP